MRGCFRITLDGHGDLAGVSGGSMKMKYCGEEIEIDLGQGSSQFFDVFKDSNSGRYVWHQVRGMPAPLGGLWATVPAARMLTPLSRASPAAHAPSS